MKQMTQPEMAAWDAGTLEYMTRQARVQARLDGLVSQAHRLAGDKKRGFSSCWGYTDAQVLEVVAGQDSPASKGLMAEIGECRQATEGYRAAIGEREGTWEDQGCWSRYFPCLNRDGHIHASLRGCPTVRFDTSMGWATGLSGKTVAEAVAELGETLCSVCFPEAPAQWCRTRSEVEREAREAAKAEREAAKYVKRLFPSEQFRSAYGHDRIETVARCKELLRLEVEFRDYYGRGEHSCHSQTAADAAQAVEVLLAREERQPGTGATQAEIDTIIERAVVRNRKDGARI